MSELKGLQARVERFWKDDQGRVVFSVAGEPLPFVVDSASVDISLIPYLATDLGVTMNYEVWPVCSLGLTPNTLSEITIAIS
ncbi:hypothetical protein CGI23_25275 [Vibrio parahaemolyticus]|uniref:hypothetical protein n=1 Tax=Vibrio parahaemolyticus TaxID=670 RepID=UPI00111D7C95|nr:hypothetical protein [Vibrio parahaemolyticus]TOK17649.1 hypothetical protein CGI23_25275 [Vibrio parahaemolyticus]